MKSLIKTNNLTPEEKYRAKLLRVYELALQLNPTKTRQETTENKPTVFVNFSGHVGKVFLDIHSKGWPSFENKISIELNTEKGYFYEAQVWKAIGILENILTRQQEEEEENECDDCI